MQTRFRQKTGLFFHCRWIVCLSRFSLILTFFENKDHQSLHYINSLVRRPSCWKPPPYVVHTLLVIFRDIRANDCTRVSGINWAFCLFYDEREQLLYTWRWYNHPSIPRPFQLTFWGTCILLAVISYQRRIMGWMDDWIRLRQKLLTFHFCMQVAIEISSTAGIRLVVMNLCSKFFTLPCMVRENFGGRYCEHTGTLPRKQALIGIHGITFSLMTLVVWCTHVCVCLDICLFEITVPLRDSAFWNRRQLCTLSAQGFCNHFESMRSTFEFLHICRSFRSKYSVFKFTTPWSLAFGTLFCCALLRQCFICPSKPVLAPMPRATSPSQWKTSVSVPHHEKGSVNDPENVHSINYTLVLSRLTEKVVKKQ